MDGVELIEIVDPDDPDVRWDASAPVSVPPVPTPNDHRARWGLVGVAAAIAVVWAAVAWFDRPPPPPPPAMAAGRYVLDAEGFLTYTADVVGDRTTGKAFAIWSDGEAGATVTVVATKGDPQPAVLAADAVEQIGDVTLVRTVDARGRAELVSERELGDGWRAVATGYGLPVDDFAGVARAVRIGDGERPLVELYDPLSPVLPRLSRVLDGVDPGHALQGGVDSVLRYHDAGGAEYTLSVAEGDAADGLPNATQALQWLGTAPTEANGVVAARRADDSVAVWAAGNDLLSLSGPATPERLVELSRSVRPALEQEWVGLLYGLHPDRRLGEADVIDVGNDSRGRWTGGVQRVEQGGTTTLQWLFTEPGDPSKVRSVPAAVLGPDGFSAETFVVDGATYVFVQATPAVAADGVVAVQQEAGDTAPPVVRPLRLTRAYLDDDTLMGVARVTGPGRVTVVYGPGGRS